MGEQERPPAGKVLKAVEYFSACVHLCCAVWTVCLLEYFIVLPFECVGQGELIYTKDIELHNAG